MSQLSDVIYVHNNEKYSTLNYGTHLKYDWDGDTLEKIPKDEYTEYFQRCRIEEFIRHNAPELEEKLKDYLDSFWYELLHLTNSAPPCGETEREGDADGHH